MKMWKMKKNMAKKHGIGRDIAMAVVGVIGTSVARNLYHRFADHR
ncbi:MAG: hypothetical protein ACOX6S_14725 [Clostridia bacterium]|jgi:hypothetical protein